MNSKRLYRHTPVVRELVIAEFLKNPFSGGNFKLESYQIDKVCQYLDQHFCQTTDEIIAYVLCQYGVLYSSSGMSVLLKRLGFVYKKPVAQPANVDEAVQDSFIEYYEAIRF